MELKAAISIVNELMDKFDLNKSGWQFKLNRNKRQIGLTRWKKTPSGVEKSISLSVYFIEHNEEWVIRDVILHEIAHALCGLEAGHSKVWKDKCIEIGARPNPSIDYAVMPSSHISVCKKCNKIVDTHFKAPKTKRGCFNCKSQANTKKVNGVFNVGDEYNE